MSGIAGYVRFWDRREGAESLALVRIAVGLVLLFDLLQIARLDLVRALWAPVEEGGMGPSTHDAPLVQFYTWFGASSTSAYTLFGLALVSALALTLGVASRLSALLLLSCSAQLSILAPNADRGIDALLRNALVLLACSGAGATWSLGARLVHGSFQRRVEIPAWPRYLLIGQLVLLYFWAGLLKQSPEWTGLGGYCALFRVLCTPHISRFEWSPALLSALYPVLQAATISTLAFERVALTVPLLLWLRSQPQSGGALARFARRYRLLELWVATGVLFHLALAVLTKLGIFPWGCLALFPALARPEQWRTWLSRPRRAERARQVTLTAT